MVSKPLYHLPEHCDSTWDPEIIRLWQEREVMRALVEHDYDHYFDDAYTNLLEALGFPGDPLWYWRVADVPEVMLRLEPWNSLLLVDPRVGDHGQ